MHVSQKIFSASDKLHFSESAEQNSTQLVLIFGSRTMLSDIEHFHAIRSAFPTALIMGCSTAGEIHGTEVSDDTLVTTAVTFKHTRLHLVKADIQENSQSFAVGGALATLLPAEDLVHVLVLSDGLKVNGTELVRGLKTKLSPNVEVTGGLSADGANFQKTLVCANNLPAEGQIVALGFYGKHIKVGYGSLGGWDDFGPERLITRSEGNVLFELDNTSALELYKRYLGEQAAELPVSGLFFPLSLRKAGETTGVVRTIIGINEDDQSMTFAGDIPAGYYARLMRANFERLIDGAIGAAKTCAKPLTESAELALLISCVGRKLVLKQRIEEEVEGVREVLGNKTVLTGFYSYGEISPQTPGTKCELHNQTMTITTFSEI